MVRTRSNFKNLLPSQSILSLILLKDSVNIVFFPSKKAGQYHYQIRKSVFIVFKTSSHLLALSAMSLWSVTAGLVIWMTSPLLL